MQTVSGDSKEAVAYALLEVIARSEGKELPNGLVAADLPDRQWVLTTYAECLRVVNGYHP